MALVHRLLEWALCGVPLTQTVDVDDVEAAIRHRKYLDTHYARVVDDTEEPVPERLTQESARSILRERPQHINILMLRRESRLPELRMAHSELHAARWITDEVTGSRYESLPRIVHFSDALLTYFGHATMEKPDVVH